MFTRRTLPARRLLDQPRSDAVVTRSPHDRARRQRLRSVATLVAAPLIALPALSFGEEPAVGRTGAVWETSCSSTKTVSSEASGSAR